MDGDWHSIAAMLARMIDRASDFCKYASDRDFRGTTMEESAVGLTRILMNQMEPAHEPTDHSHQSLFAPGFDLADAIS
jgi:hypothetical protein